MSHPDPILREWEDDERGDDGERASEVFYCGARLPEPSLSKPAKKVPREVASERIDVDEPVDRIGSGGYALATYEAALWCLANTDNYADCVLAAVNLGDDTDTTGAVAGALAGIAYGLDAIPGPWAGALRGKDVIEACLF